MQDEKHLIFESYLVVDDKLKRKQEKENTAERRRQQSKDSKNDSMFKDLPLSQDHK